MGSELRPDGDPLGREKACPPLKNLLPAPETCGRRFRNGGRRERLRPAAALRGFPGSRRREQELPPVRGSSSGGGGAAVGVRAINERARCQGTPQLVHTSTGSGRALQGCPRSPRAPATRGRNRSDRQPDRASLSLPAERPAAHERGQHEPGAGHLAALRAALRAAAAGPPRRAAGPGLQLRPRAPPAAPLRRGAR